MNALYTLQAVYSLMSDNKKNDWSEIRQHLLGNPRLLNEFKEIDLNNISSKRVKKAQQIITRNGLTPEIVMTSSQSLGHFLTWANTIITLHKMKGKMSAQSSPENVEQPQEELGALTPEINQPQGRRELDSLTTEVLDQYQSFREPDTSLIRSFLACYVLLHGNSRETSSIIGNDFEGAWDFLNDKLPQIVQEMREFDESHLTEDRIVVAEVMLLSKVFQGFSPDESSGAVIGWIEAQLIHWRIDHPEN